MGEVTEKEKEEGWVATEMERQNYWRSVQDITDRLRHSEWERGSFRHLRGSSFIRTRRRVCESHADELLWSCSGGGERGWSLNQRMRSIAATWLILGVSLSTCSISISTPAIKETGANGERAAEIMRVAESSCGFPIFGNGRSSRSCGFTDSSRASWSCSKSRSPHFKDIYLFRDEDRIYSKGVTGASSRCLHSVECTCSQSSNSRCTADVKVTTAVQLSAVVAVTGGGSGSGHWMTSVADEGHLDPLAETSQGRSRQELWCLCKQYLSVFTSWKLVCFVCLCMCVLCSHLHPWVHNMRSVWHWCCIAWWWWEAECCYQLWLSGSGQSSILLLSDPLGRSSWKRPIVSCDMMT